LLTIILLHLYQIKLCLLSTNFSERFLELNMNTLRPTYYTRRLLRCCVCVCVCEQQLSNGIIKRSWILVDVPQVYPVSTHTPIYLGIRSLYIKHLVQDVFRFGFLLIYCCSIRVQYGRWTQYYLYYAQCTNGKNENVDTAI